jgi:multiple sugar transport system substrate-binding protein
MVFDGVYMLGDLERLDDLEVIGAPIPVIGSRPGTLGDSHVVCIRKGVPAEKREAAIRFIRFLSDESLTWAGAGQVPARRSVRETPGFKALPIQHAFARQVPHVMYPPKTPVLFEIQLELDLAVEKAFRGRTTPKEALEAATRNVQAYLDRDARLVDDAGGAP